MLGESRRLSLTTSGSFTKAAFGAVSGPELVVAQRGAGPAAFAAVQPAGPAGRLSVKTSPFAVCVPAFVSFTPNPICEPAVTIAASALLVIESNGSLTLQDGNLNEPILVCQVPTLVAV